MGQPKHEKICNEIRQAIASGKYKDEQRLPTEAQFVQQYETSRPTVARALRDLQHEGLIVRRAGSGTYVRKAETEHGHLFGLVIPGLGETEIFDPICREMARCSQAGHHALLWAASAADTYGDRCEQAWQSAQQCIRRKVAGVFFAPLELAPDSEKYNERIVEALDAANIPILLLDRDLYRYPRRSAYDRIGINNRLAGYRGAEHLLNLGCKKIGFFYRPYSAETVASRLAGYREALSEYGVVPEDCWVVEGDPGDAELVKSVTKSSGVEAFICANDLTAANLMRTLDLLGIRTPEDVRIVGIDDVRYASLLKVPLTTMHQPCQHIGMAAVSALSERIANPGLPPRDILFHCQLVVRESCGAKLKSSKPREGRHKAASSRPAPATEGILT